MVIVINALSARLGGGQTYLINLLNYIPKSDDLRIIVLAPRDLKLPEHKALTRFYPKIRLDNPLVRTLWEKTVLPGYLKKVNANILFCPGGVVATTPPRGCKVVTMFRNMIPFDAAVLSKIPFGLQRIRNKLLHRTMLRSMSQADMTIFISDYARSVIEKLTTIPRGITIPHGIDQRFRGLGADLHYPDALVGRRYILYVSRFDVYKHHYEVVQGYADLPKALRDNFALVLIGESDSTEATKVRQLIHRLDISDQVMIFGGVPYFELPSFYRHAQLIVFASSCENCPNILLESLGSGRPVISSNVMPMPEFGGEAVAYFSPFVPEEITKTMFSVLSDHRYASSLALRGAEQGSKYEWSITAEKTWSNIFKLIEDAS
ncbi:glycosyltransferase family 4 protein [Pseudomonas hunanensis]|uniref:glycosyltransferase family 4 protein n=1 Tax=Pseudomonas hunanensis TaxID=1247546 RepID=UPI003D0234AC